MESNVKRTWKPTTVGILNIVSGALRALTAIGIIIAMIAIGNINIMRYLPPSDAPFIVPLIGTILIVALVVSLLEAVFPIIGGIYAIQRKKWGWALAGSIVAILGVLPLGIASTIIVAIAKDEFE